MSEKILIDGHFIRFGRHVLSRAQVAEANLETGEVLMASGHIFRLTRPAVEAWFSDYVDFMQIFPPHADV